ncbi:ribonuclease H-like domain-containing protein [Tanacetum coccineum]
MLGITLEYLRIDVYRLSQGDKVIQNNGNGHVSVTTDTSGQIKILPPKSAEEVVARERERKARTTLLMAIPEDHLAKFHKMTDAKEMWNAIKSRFGGNDESKKMQKYILKQQFEGFSVSNTDGIHKGYERFQSLLSQLEIHGAGVSTEDANQKFLRSLPSAWLQVSLIMRNKPGMDSLSFDDLYNNLRVFENDVKGSTASTSNLQNIAFVSENTSSTNNVSTAYGVSNTSGQNSKLEQTSSYSLLASQSSIPQLDHEDLDQVDEYDLEEMDLKWQVAMISMRIKKFCKKTGRKLQFDAKEPVGFDKTKVECYNCHKTGHFARECRTKEDNRRRDGWNTGNRDGWNAGNKDGSRTGKKEESRALVTVDGECVDWTTHSEDDENYAFMASNSSGSNTQVTSCSCECKESYANLKRLYDVQREELSDASIEIKAYTQALKKVEAQLVAHQQGQLWYEQKIKFMKIDLDDKTDVLTYHKTLLAKAQKEKDDLEVIVDKWNHSSKNLGKIANYSMSARDKFGLGYGDYRYSGILSYENEVMQSVFKCNKSDSENTTLHKRINETCEMHAVSPPMTGNYLPSGPDVEIDDSQYTYGPEKTQPSEPESQTNELDACDSNISTEPSELVFEPVVNESHIEVQPKVWSDAPIIEEYESDSDDECVTVQTKGNDTPSFANKQVKTPTTSGIRACRETLSNDNPPPTPPPPTTPQTAPQQAPHTVSTIKLPILKKGEYDIWAIKMEHYLAHTDYPIWEVIQKGNGPVSVTTDTDGVIRVLPPRTAKETLARERERKARTILLMALPEDHLAKFYKMTDAKDMWEAIKSRFGGNDEYKKMQEEPKALVTIDGEGVDWTSHSEEDEDYALMACNSSESDTEMECMLYPTHDSTKPSELVYEPVVNESNVECQPKVWSDAPIIEEYESDSEDEYVSIPIKEKETPSFANKQVKTPRETVKNQFTHSQKPKVGKKELGYGFTIRASFVCGSLNHLIRDCDFHEKRMARKAELNNGWNKCAKELNKLKPFVPSDLLTRNL